MIGGGGGGAGTAAESAATWTAVVRLISSFRSFQEATLPTAKPSAQVERRAPMLAIFSCCSKFWSFGKHVQGCRRALETSGTTSAAQEARKSS